MVIQYIKCAHSCSYKERCKLKVFWDTTSQPPPPNFKKNTKNPRMFHSILFWHRREEVSRWIKNATTPKGGNLMISQWLDRHVLFDQQFQVKRSLFSGHCQILIHEKMDMHLARLFVTGKDVWNSPLKGDLCLPLNHLGTTAMPSFISPCSC